MFIHSITFLLDQMDHKSNKKKLNMKGKRKLSCECRHPQPATYLRSVEVILRMSTSAIQYLLTYFLIKSDLYN